MLQTIRERIQGWIAGTIISLIIISFLFWGIHSYFQSDGSNLVAATVNGHDISKEQFAVAYDRLRREIQQNNHSAIDESTLKEKTIRALIEMDVLKQASVKAGYRISDAQIDDYLMSMPQFQENGVFSQNRFQSVLDSSLLSANEVIDVIHTGLLIDQPKIGILLSSFALPGETNQLVGLVDETRQFDYLIIPKTLFSDKKYVVSDSAIENDYRTHKTEYMTPDRVRLEYIQVSISDLLKNIKMTEEEIKSYYNDNVNSFTQPLRWQLEALFIPQLVTADKQQTRDNQKLAENLLTQVHDGQGLKKLRLQYASSDFNPAKWVTLGEVSQDLQATVKNLAQTGEWSAPIITARGIYLIHVLGRQAPALEPYQSVREKVRQALARQKAEEMFANIKERLADLSYAHSDSLLPAANALNLKINETDWFFKGQSEIKGILSYEQIRSIAFSNELIALHNNSDVLAVDANTMVVVRVKAHQASAVLPLEAVRSKISDQLRAEQMDQAMHDFAQSYIHDLNQGVLPQALAEKNHLSWVKSDKWVSRYGAQIDSAILDLAFRLPNPDLLKHTLSVGAVRLPKAYAVVILKKIQSGQIKDKKQASVFGEQIQNSQGVLEYNLYKQSLIKQADIQVHLEK